MTILELGYKKIRCLVYQKQGKGIAIQKAESFNFDSDIFPIQDIGKAAKPIKDFCKEKRISTSPLSLIISHPGVIFRDLTLPPMSHKEIEAVIINDIERGPRFSSKKYLYTYSAHYMTGGRKIRVVYFVLEKEILNKAIRLVKAAGFSLKSVSLCPATLLGLPAVNPLDGKDLMLVYPQEKTTYAVITNGKVCQGIYTIDIGLKDIYDKEGNQIKEKQFGLFGEEIRRTLKSYETAQHAIISEVILFSDNQLTGDLSEKIASSLGRTVKAPQLPAQAKISSKVIDAPLDGTYFSCLGKALEPLRGNPCFNFLKIWDYRKTSEYKNKVLLFVGIYLAVVGILFFKPVSQVYNKVSDENRQGIALMAKTEGLEARTNILEQQRKQYLATKNNLLRQATVVHKLKKISWSEAFFKIGEVLPEDIWLTSFVLGKSGSFYLKGKGMTLDSVAAFIRALKKVDLFGEAKLKSTREAKIEEEIVREFDIESFVIVSPDETVDKKEK
ncbi:MAG: PilN domain-containing protein [Candidatus Aceula meridiana]|nr:PilN domain-containing protein [Candidatus Aceula meridiana]